ncbi:polysaccharide deacetylase family protein [Hyunsoonleella rubra]|uniref:Polysaccharide deacetylase family protein n=1 Tax=Hyunsoonleella rubra TaxID=1737062 RepID=A0ABW5TCI6_9FLAO
MTIIPVKTPEVVKSLFPNYVWNIETSEKVLYLTFDDGPTPEITEWVLDELEMHNAKATFFCIGANIEKYPEIFQKVLKIGHRIGNHTQHHLKGWKFNTKDYLEDVKMAEGLLNSKFQKLNPKIHNKAIVNCKSPIVNLFRPPYGKIKRKQGRKLIEMGYKIIMWDVLAFDWKKSVSPEECMDNVLSKATNGSIIVFHDSVKASKNMQYALPKVLAHFSAKGYKFEALE